MFKIHWSYGKSDNERGTLIADNEVDCGIMLHYLDTIGIGDVRVETV